MQVFLFLQTTRYRPLCDTIVKVVVNHQSYICTFYTSRTITTRLGAVLDRCGGVAFVFNRICVSPSGRLTRCSATTTVFLPAGNTYMTGTQSRMVRCRCR